MVIVHVYNKNEWCVTFGGTPYLVKPKNKDKAKDWCIKKNADICYNLAYFNMNNYDTVNYVKGSEGDYGYGGVTERVVVAPSNVCGGYAVGIKNSVVVMRGSGSRSRNGIGITTKGNIIIAQSTNKITEKSFCNEVNKQVQCYYKENVELFMMEDGGGSTQMYSAISDYGIAPEGGRKVPTVTLVKRIKSISINRELKTGCKGDDVRYLQLLLGGLVCDGSFGSATKNRVKDYQKKHKLKVDGCVGEETKKSLKI